MLPIHRLAGVGVPWEEVPPVVTEMLRTALGAGTVKLTLVDRPLQVKEGDPSKTGANCCGLMVTDFNPLHTLGQII
jgi:hypothetical protein